MQDKITLNFCVISSVPPWPADMASQRRSRIELNDGVPMPSKTIWSSPCVASQASWRPPAGAAPLLIPCRAGLANPLAWFSLFFVRAEQFTANAVCCRLVSSTPLTASPFSVQCTSTDDRRSQGFRLLAAETRHTEASSGKMNPATAY